MKNVPKTAPLVTLNIEPHSNPNPCATKQTRRHIKKNIQKLKKDGIELEITSKKHQKKQVTLPEEFQRLIG